MDDGEGDFAGVEFFVLLDVLVEVFGFGSPAAGGELGVEFIARLPLYGAFGGTDFDIGSEADLVDAGFEPMQTGNGEPAGWALEVYFSLGIN